MSTTRHSPAPWGYEYSPYTVHSPGTHGTKNVGDDIPAFEVFDADGNKVFDTNEDTPADLQEANACLASAAPRLLASLITCATLLADHDGSEGEEGEAYRGRLPPSPRRPGGQHENRTNEPVLHCHDAPDTGR